MYALSMKERERALDDAHAISGGDEDPNFVNSSLMKLEQCLCDIKANTVYEEAEHLSDDFVRNPHFRVMFLRAEHYDIRQAAERMLRFFALKKELFGRDKLVKEITLKDLDEDDMDVLRAGEGQISPVKDAAGRPVVTFAQILRRFKHVINLKRAIFYMYMAAMESTDAQVKGIVGIFYNVDTPAISSHNSSLRSSLPINFRALHLCVNEVSTYVKACAAICTLSTRNRVRYRLHFGSHVECLYELVTFGIPRNAIPVSSSGEVSTHEHLEWVQRRIDMEMEAAGGADKKCHAIAELAMTSPHAPTPPSFASPDDSTVSSTDDFEFHPNDVLFGRGKAVVDHPGNTKFRRLVDVYMRKYLEAERLEKTCIAEAIVQMIKESSGRFLKKEPGSNWEEVDGPEARKKVAHAFRNRRQLR